MQGDLVGDVTRQGYSSLKNRDSSARMTTETDGDSAVQQRYRRTARLQSVWSSTRPWERPKT